MAPSSISPPAASRHRNAIEVERIRTQVLAALPLNAAQAGPDRVKRARIAQLPEDADIEVRSHVKAASLTIGETQQKGVLRPRFDGLDSWADHVGA